MQSHWMVQTIPGLFAAQLATAAPGAPLQIDYLDVEWMFSKSILRSAWLDDQDLASWTTLAQFLGELVDLVNLHSGVRIYTPINTCGRVSKHEL